MALVVIGLPREGGSERRGGGDGPHCLAGTGKNKFKNRLELIKDFFIVPVP
jgi:hypothetical protein